MARAKTSGGGAATPATRPSFLRFDSPPPLLGENNPYVYRELLGASASEYRRLEGEKHIGMDYVPDVR